MTMQLLELRYQITKLLKFINNFYLVNADFLIFRIFMIFL